MRNDHHRRDGRDQRHENRPPKKVVVLGAGISGLVAAYELSKRSRVEVIVLEAAPRAGGKIKTENVDGQIVESGPDSFLTTKPEMVELVRELGLEGDLIPTGADSRVSVLVGGRMLPMPSGLNLVAPTRALPFAFSPLFSMKAKLHMALEPLRPARRDGADESLADFTRRRLGDEALERLVGPMLAGIYAGDPEKLSVRSTFPQLLELEKKGGLVRSMWSPMTKASSKRPAGMTTFMTLKGGLSKIVDELRRRLPAGALKEDCPAQAVRRRDGKWEIVTPNQVFTADAVVSALPAGALADAVEGLDPELCMRLREIPFASTATSALIYDAKDLPRPPRGFGFLAARGEGLTITAATYSSSKFPARAEAGKIVVRAFVGGAGREADAEGAITRLESKVRADLDKTLGLGGAQPVAQRTARWIKANPQYDVGHSRRLDRLASCLKSHDGLVLAGASYGGVGLPDCVRSGRRAAELAAAGPRRNHDRPGLA
ncbi:MAG: protoporphyrinogen oxidase [Elusimicrobiota bacterium]|nr:MAG: protoporphyrinogen oxidase [Elusimicrobiota bacterium]